MGSWIEDLYSGIYDPPATAVAPPSGVVNRGVTINTPTGGADTSMEDMMIEAGVGPGVNPRNAYGRAQTSMRDALIANNSRLPADAIGVHRKRIRLPSGEYVEVVDPATPFTGSKNPALMASLLASTTPGYNVKPGTTRNPIMPVGAPALNEVGFDPWAGMRGDGETAPVKVPGMSLGSVKMGGGGNASDSYVPSGSPVRKLAEQYEKNLLKNVSIFDVYEGKNLGEGKKAYSVSFTLQDEAQTLTDKVIESTMDRLMKGFEKEIGAIIRK